MTGAFDVPRPLVSRRAPSTAAAARGNPFVGNAFPVGSRVSPPQGQTITLTDTNGIVSKWKPRIPVDGYGLVFGFSNIGALALPTASIIFEKVVVELPSGTRLPVTVDGARSFTLVPGRRVMCDPLMIPVSAGDLIGLLVDANVPTSGTPILASMNPDTASGEGRTSGASAASLDIDVAGTNPGAATQVAPGPTYIGVLNVDSAAAPIIGVMGDSIPQGTGDSNSSTARVRNKGWLSRALDDNFPFVNMSRAGSYVAAHTGSSGGIPWILDYPYTRDSWLLMGTEIMLCTTLINDIRNTGDAVASQVTDDELKAGVRAIWRQARLFGARKVIQVTPTPRVTFDADAKAQYLRILDWLNDPATLAAEDDLDAVVDEPRQAVVDGNNDWASGMASDNVHPNATGHAAMAAAFPLELLAL